MLRIEWSEALGRPLRQDEPIAECGISSYTIMREMLRKGDGQGAAKLLDYLQHEFKWLHDLYSDWVYADLDYIAKHYGEEELPKFIRYSKNHLDQMAYKALGKASILERVYQTAELMRAHRSGPGETGRIQVWEEDLRYVIEFDPCGSAGRMRRTGELDGLPPRTGAPFHLGRTSKPYPWSWSKAGVPYYCTHCCIWSEQMAIEKTGVPSKITDYQDDPQAPCRWFFYKRPEDIPEEFYTRIGKIKPEP